MQANGMQTLRDKLKAQKRCRPHTAWSLLYSTLLGYSRDDMADIVVVTGASGFIAGELVEQLLVRDTW